MDTVKWFKQYLKELTAQGLTLLISSHVQNDLEALCDIVYVIEGGRITETIDIHAEQAKQMRYIDTTNNTRLQEILDTLNYYYVMEEDKIMLNISDERWSQVKEQLAKEAVEIEELSKVKVLENRLN